MIERTSSLPSRKLYFALATAAIAILIYFILPFPEPARRCAAVFIFAVGFWALEIIPLFATSLCVVLLLTFLLTKPGGVLGLDETGYKLFLVPFSSPVIMLFFGGFILAGAAKKHSVDQFIMQKVLSKLGSRSFVLLIGFVFISAFFSMWISNTAATALMLMLIQPFLKNLDASDPLRKGLVLGVAFGANIGGIGTPIGTPPNAIAIGILAEHGIYLDFLSWMAMAIPLVILILILAIIILRLLFPPQSKQVQFEIPEKVKLSKQGTGMILIALLIIVLWLTAHSHRIPEALTALLGVGLFAAFRIIDVEDLKNIDWDILVLMWGGLALGLGVQASGLIDQITDFPLFQQHGVGLVVIFSILALVLSSFMSNTATANLLLPLVMSFPLRDQILLSITVALSCSFALAFPISTPPNAMAYSTGIIKTRDLFRSGAILSIVALILVLTGFDFVIVRIFPNFFQYL